MKIIVAKQKLQIYFIKTVPLSTKKSFNNGF